MKEELRKKYKKLRKTLSQSDLEQFSKAIFESCRAHFDLNQKNISIFIPIEKFQEINTWHFIKNIESNFYLPIVKNKNLVHIKYENEDQLQMSDWGILEPSYGNEVDPHLFDIVVVPLLAYDTNGNRIGYGAGFYDGFLKDCNSNCIFIGVSFFEPETTLIETYSTDIPLNYCITPKNIISFK